LCQPCRDILLKDAATALQAVEVNAVTPALERVVEANTLLSGLGFESGGLYNAHSIHNGLTSQPNHLRYTHGEKVAFGLLTQLVLEGKPKAEIDEVVQFCVDVGLPVTLDDVGVNADNEMDQSQPSKFKSKSKAASTTALAASISSKDVAALSALVPASTAPTRSPARNFALESMIHNRDRD